MFTWFDIATLTIITISSMFGLYTGAVKLIIRLSSFIFSIVFAYYLYPYLSDILAQYLTHHIILVIISSIISYIISLGTCSLLTSKFISIIVNGGIIDRFFGLVAGIIRGTIICMLLFSVIAIFFSGSYLNAETLEDISQNTTNDKYPVWLQDSVTTTYLEQLTKWFIQTLPQNMLQSITLPKKSELIDMTNSLEKPSFENNMLDLPNNLPDDFNQELEELLRQQKEKND